jgi:hypothetical protein
LRQQKRDKDHKGAREKYHPFFSRDFDEGSNPESNWSAHRREFIAVEPQYEATKHEETYAGICRK